MAKQKNPPKEKFLIFASGKYQGEANSYEEAENKAIELLEDSESDIYFFQVSRAWSVEYPEEPEPEVFSVNLENVDIG